MTVPPLLGLVLAGGRSERLGQDKATLQIGGVSLLDRAVTLLVPAVPEVWVAVRPDQAGEASRSRHRLLLDPVAGLGPAGGLLAAVRARPDAAWLVLACDMPGVTPAVLGGLLAYRQPDRGGVTYRSPGDRQPEPLCALYEPATLAALAEQAAAGRPVSPRALLTACDVLLLEPPRAADFSSINTPADLARFTGK